MKRLLLTMAFALLPQAAMALPPATGTVHTFYDPIFEGVVVCDTFDQLKEIATADQPGDVFREYLTTPDVLNEPTCAAVQPTGLVRNVKPLGLMEEDGFQFFAYAVETQFGDITAYVLFLEKASFAQA